ncbi:MAG: hypothetical protein P1V36_00370 [Planctomycetota bacterium]|nr:hypothetical protein [Planctomycetota bacterium]
MSNPVYTRVVKRYPDGSRLVEHSDKFGTQSVFVNPNGATFPLQTERPETKVSVIWSIAVAAIFLLVAYATKHGA